MLALSDEVYYERPKSLAQAEPSLHVRLGKAL
jgi:hypothetical protein